ncbi:hypothetical protein CK623_06615 [Vandammella animalimorsus]|uniref:Uncharacterized protein n=1 Tax=Vandammella animalimorsus TaxID=2029117 RepID=A0A2A2ARA4_9BURK|nr:hypothetical protein CK623_06615 [Vandammella animalimorsus]
MTSNTCSREGQAKFFGSIRTSLIIRLQSLHGVLNHTRVTDHFTSLPLVLDGFVKLRIFNNICRSQEFNITFANFALILAVVNTIKLECPLGNHITARQRAAGIRQFKESLLAIAILTSTPHITRRQEDIEVKHIVRVTSTTITHFDDLTVFLIGIDDIHQRITLTLHRVVRLQQDVTNTTTVDFKLCSRSSSAISNSSLDKRHFSNCSTSEASQSNSHTQRKNVLFHEG